MKNETTFPGFTAEASLVKPVGRYQGYYAAVGVSMAGTRVLPSQFEGLYETAPLEGGEFGEAVGDEVTDETGALEEGEEMGTEEGGEFGEAVGDEVTDETGALEEGEEMGTEEGGEFGEAVGDEVTDETGALEEGEEMGTDEEEGELSEAIGEVEATE